MEYMAQSHVLTGLSKLDLITTRRFRRTMFRDMRFPIILLATLMAVPVAADDGFALGLTEMDFSAEGSEEVTSELTALASEDVPSQRPEVLAFQASLNHTTAAQRVDALWNSDMATKRTPFQ